MSYTIINVGKRNESPIGHKSKHHELPLVVFLVYLIWDGNTRHPAHYRSSPPKGHSESAALLPHGGGRQDEGNPPKVCRIATSADGTVRGRASPHTSKK